MPTYHYRCNKCQFEFEETQSIKADALTDCRKCDGTVQRVISGGAGFVFKGSGFYTTDYRNSTYKKDAAKDSGKSDSKAGSKSESKSESKPKTSDSKTVSTKKPKN